MGATGLQRILIDFDAELKDRAPACVRQVMVQRCESSPGFVVAFELLFSKEVSYEEAQSPRLAAENFWKELQEVIGEGLKSARAGADDDAGDGEDGGGAVVEGAFGGAADAGSDGGDAEVRDPVEGGE